MSTEPALRVFSPCTRAESRSQELEDILTLLFHPRCKNFSFPSSQLALAPKVDEAVETNGRRQLSLRGNPISDQGCPLMRGRPVRGSPARLRKPPTSRLSLAAGSHVNVLSHDLIRPSAVILPNFTRSRPVVFDGVVEVKLTTLDRFAVFIGPVIRSFTRYRRPPLRYLHSRLSKSPGREGCSSQAWLAPGGPNLHDKYQVFFQANRTASKLLYFDVYDGDESGLPTTRLGHTGQGRNSFMSHSGVVAD
ncbi:hypothetical protein BO78DRAFT_45131 [Aspergillus sclerotiicarbonarius CBS 121057]|uniref:Uncharacterized protein n=1 Tax=Aspergillus sclerotiicarbonarius (strain CBS 121057 / IBT 28362) TaxID=1448318 RepID=A0A319E9H7_ASPSB|nr:hypothetical protein BO78DRAFT_45131 [Aspergillus sclerotiicarbonarius CBS 121057]